MQVIVDENESEERLLNRFRREVMRAGVIQEVKRRRYFENTQDEKKRRTRDAAKRNKRRSLSLTLFEFELTFLLDNGTEIVYALCYHCWVSQVRSFNVNYDTKMLKLGSFRRVI